MGIPLNPPRAHLGGCHRQAVDGGAAAETPVVVAETLQALTVGGQAQTGFRVVVSYLPEGGGGHLVVAQWLWWTCVESRLQATID